MDSELGPLLIEAGILTPHQLAHVLARRHRQGGILLAHLIEENLVDEDRIVSLFCSRRAYRRASEEDLSLIPASVLAMVPAHLAWRYGVVPLAVEGEILYLAAADPSDAQVQAEIAYLTGHRVVPMVARFSAITQTLLAAYGPDNASFPPSFPPPYDPQADQPWEDTAPAPLQSDDELIALLNGAVESSSQQVPTLPGLGAPMHTAQKTAPRFFVPSPPAILAQASPRTPLRFYIVTDPTRTGSDEQSSRVSTDKLPQPTLRGVGAPPPPPPLAPEENTDTIPNLTVPTLPDQSELEREETLVMAGDHPESAQDTLTGNPFQAKSASLQEVGSDEEDSPTQPGEPSLFAPPVQGGGDGPPKGGPASDAAPRPRRRRVLPPLAPPRPVGPLFSPPDGLIARIGKAPGVDEVIDLVFEYLAGSFPRRIFFAVRPGIAQGYRCAGLSAQTPPFAYKVPLDTPSLFTSVLLSQFPFVGELPENPATRELLTLLGKTPCFALLLPITLGTRAVGIFFGDQGNPHRGADGPTFIHLRRVGMAVAQAFYRIIQERRASQGEV